ncbi:putative N-acetyltransferase 8B [Ochotona princeps]|uniref:putative N-acetyltransferase 8B n=1 Tax=Ochotona princeps TaxID=9978 RepID=UPI002714A539|nr:putative N-acetyltransferase 8B [Ochotona princeps]
MAPYHIRKYHVGDHKQVLTLFAQGMEEHIPATFHHLLKLPRALLLLAGGPLILLLVSGSWLLALMASLILLAGLKFVATVPWKQYIAMSLQTDMADIMKTYLSGRGSCFWVAESEGQVVGTVGALPVEDPTLREKQLQLFHLSVGMEHRGQGIAKSLVRTVIQFAQDQGYSEVVLETSVVQSAALNLYQAMGFQVKRKFNYNISSRLVGVYTFRLVFPLASADVRNF